MALTESSQLAHHLGKAAVLLKKGRQIETVGDLLAFWPTRYIDSTVGLGNLSPGRFVVAVAEVRTATTRPMKQRRGKMLTATITDGEADIDLTFFSAYGHEGKLIPGAKGIFAGEVSRFGQRFQLAHPGYTLLDTTEEAAGPSLIPIYRRVKSMHTWTVSECVRLVMDLLDDIDDPIPDAVAHRRKLPTRIEALRGIHTPARRADIGRGRARFAFEEAFVLQTVLAQRRAAQADDSAIARRSHPGGLLDAFDARLPFTLTTGQREIGEAIAADLAREVPMHRLLQGEVGSGKTLVALRAMLAVADAGGQAALLAPTEVLAQQHHRSITAMLGDLAQAGMLGGSEQATKVALLTGSMPTAERRRQLLDIASGDAGLVVGTHALLQDKVTFQDLALVVVDEQHRFGVEQRDALRAKGSATPHILVMTATPIPRTIAMTVFGDLETSTLRELPAGRAPITSHVVPEWKEWFARTWERVAEEVSLGRQAYVVCPRIGGTDAGASDLDGADIVEERSGADPDDDGEGMPDRDASPPDSAPARHMHGVVELLEELRAQPALKGLKIEALHGRMPADDKDATMRAFAAGDIDVLVSTTVIEVGVDVPNASAMVIMDADRFGVSQLHQLRGRVGRGGLPGLCLLVSGNESDAVGERLEAVAATTDGFALAELDLRQRREGDILGAAQHGRRNQLQFLHVLDHADVISQAREDAFALVAEDPTLADHPRLARAVAERVDAQQAAYLERG